MSETYCEKHGINLVQSGGVCALCERGVEVLASNERLQEAESLIAMLSNDMDQHDFTRGYLPHWRPRLRAFLEGRPATYDPKDAPPVHPETASERKFTGVGELERTGYIPDGSAAERETTAGPDRRPLCENCGEQYHKHGKGNLACPGSEMGNVYRAQATPAMPHASLALKEFMSELGEIMSMEDGATPADYLRRAREIRQWCSDHQGSAVKTSCFVSQDRFENDNGSDT